MSSDSLIRQLPDLVIGVRRDGVILALNAGHGVGSLKPQGDSLGRNIAEVWPENVATLVRQLTRRAISDRTSVEARFRDGGREFEARASAQGPDRAICVIRAVSQDALADPSEATGERLSPQIDRRGFLQRFKESTSVAVLREKPLAVAVVHVDGISDIAQAISPKVSEQIMTTAILRLSSLWTAQTGAQSWYLGQLSESLLALVFDSPERDWIEERVAQVCRSLHEPLQSGGDVFQLTASAGVALLGQDASSARGLLDHARAAVNEARRGGGGKICFFTDTLRLKSLARLDVARELHDAIANREIQLKYVGRHDLTSGACVVRVGYLRWMHPLRGEIRPVDFLRVAETTGLGTTLSRAAMKWLQEDYVALSRDWGREVRISFGALRHHLSHEEFVRDFEALLDEGVIPPERLELRISERNLAVRAPADLRPLAERGVRLIVDEVGRGAGSLDWLARAPVKGLQLDRARVLAARQDPVATRFCRASIAMAQALGMLPIAAGIDNTELRDCLIELGCSEGSGDLYRGAPEIARQTAAEAEKPAASRSKRSPALPNSKRAR